MLGLTNSQAMILDEMIKFDIGKEGKAGMTSNMAEKKGINRKTFTDNIERMVSNHLVHITQIEKHGHQKWKYYRSTSLGELEYLKWSMKDATVMRSHVLKKFAPLITKYWHEVSEAYGKITDLVLAETINSIDVEWVVISEYKNRVIVFKKQPLETMKLTVGSVEMVFHRDINYFTDEKKVDTLKTFFDNHENADRSTSIQSRFSFAFYFNLINLEFRFGNYFNVENATMPFIKFDDELVKKRNLEKIITECQKNRKKVKQNTKKILNIISKDIQISNLFEKTIDEISTKIKEPAVIRFLQELER